MMEAVSGGSPGCRGALPQWGTIAEGVFLRSLGLVSPSTPNWPGGVGRVTRAELPNPGLSFDASGLNAAWVPKG